ncbi:co-chaperone GroES [Candidatus Sumerlaeota bacterium]
MRTGNRKIVVVGDRVLIKPNIGDGITELGLILPQSVTEKERIQAGHVVSAGPGHPISAAEPDIDEPWRAEAPKSRHIPLQAEPGDYALFLKKHAVEIEFDSQKYVIVPHAAILILLREETEFAH